MAEHPPAEPPSRWSVINDYSKTVVTLAGVLLAFIATFADKLQIAQFSDGTRLTLIAAIVLFLLSTAFALVVPACLDRYLRICAEDEPENTANTEKKELWKAKRRSAAYYCKLFANFSFGALFFAVLALGIVAAIRIASWKPHKNEIAALTESKVLLNAFSEISSPKWQIQSFVFDATSECYEVMFVDQGTSTRFKVTVPRGEGPAAAVRMP